MAVVAKFGSWGKDKDHPETIAAELAAMRNGIGAAKAEAERLGAEWLSAASQADAEAIEARRRECLRVAQRDEARLPELEGRLAAAKAARQAAALERHRHAIGALYPKLKRAIEAAAAVQVEATRAREAAIAELGEGIVAGAIPVIAYTGFLLPDLVALWAAEQDRVWSAATQRAPAPPSAAQNARPGAIKSPLEVTQPARIAKAPAEQRRDAAEPPPAATPTTRKPRRAPDPPGAGERQVIAIRPGITDINGEPVAIGAKGNLDAARALRLAAQGAVELVADGAGQ